KEYVMERELYTSRVKTNGHGDADAKTCQQIIVRIGPGIATARADGFIGDKVMFTCDDFLLEIVGTAAHDDARCPVVVFCSHNLESGAHDTRERVTVAPHKK